MQAPISGNAGRDELSSTTAIPDRDAPVFDQFAGVDRLLARFRLRLLRRLLFVGGALVCADAPADAIGPMK
jgi:hypothetical protein